MHIRLRRFTQPTNEIGSLLTLGIHAVAHGQFQVRFAKGIHNGGVSAVGIIISEKEHKSTSQYQNLGDKGLWGIDFFILSRRKTKVNWHENWKKYKNLLNF
jgi:hypothetical protein